MNPLVTVVFVVGIAVGWLPTFGWYEYWETITEKKALEAERDQERKNNEIVTKYHDALAGVLAHYQLNPVRVRVQGSKECPGGITTDAENVVLTVGGNKGSNGKAANP